MSMLSTISGFFNLRAAIAISWISSISFVVMTLTISRTFRENHACGTLRKFRKPLFYHRQMVPGHHNIYKYYHFFEKIGVDGSSTFKFKGEKFKTDLLISIRIMTYDLLSLSVITPNKNDLFWKHAVNVFPSTRKIF